jgi:tRNA G18 (ribose-2'-O)-methylase SpoU
VLAFVAAADDARLRDYRHLAEPAAMERAGLFVAEGRWVVERLLARPQYRTRSVLVTPTAHAALVRAVGADALDRVAVYVVEQSLMNDVVGFNIHRGCLALAERPPLRTVDEPMLTGAQRVIVLEGVNNPDNVGGIFRSAAAFGADLVVLGPACGDPLYRKAIRTSMAATLDVPYASVTSWPGALDAMRSAGLRVLALTPHRDATPLDTVDTDGRIALLLGTEGSGLTRDSLDHASEHVRIHITDRVDSLNVTVAASIAMHHFFHPAPRANTDRTDDGNGKHR